MRTLMPDWVRPISSPAAVKPRGIGDRDEAAQKVEIQVDPGHAINDELSWLG